MQRGRKKTYNKQQIKYILRFFKEKLEQRGRMEDLKHAKSLKETEDYIAHLEKENKTLTKKLKEKSNALKKITKAQDNTGQQSFLG